MRSCFMSNIMQTHFGSEGHNLPNCLRHVTATVRGVSMKQNKVSTTLLSIHRWGLICMGKIVTLKSGNFRGGTRACHNIYYCNFSPHEKW